MKKKDTKKKKVKYGTVDLINEEFEPKNCQIRVSFMVPGDIYDEYKKKAKNLKTDTNTEMLRVLKLHADFFMS